MFERVPVWLWINLLSLDGPLVALIWQDFLSRCYPAQLLPQGRWMLGLTVWAIYIADRLLDTRAPATENETPRHCFYRAHTTGACVFLAVILVADLTIALLWLPSRVFTGGIAIAAAVVAYLFTFSAPGKLTAWKRGLLWKKSSASILFTAGVFVVASAWMQPHSYTLLWPAIAFALLCKGNLVLIEHWDRSGRFSRPGAVWIAFVLFALLCAAGGQSRWYYAIALSSAGLAALSFGPGRLSEDSRRVLADAALMTPLLLR